MVGTSKTPQSFTAKNCFEAGKPPFRTAPLEFGLEHTRTASFQVSGLGGAEREKTVLAHVRYCLCSGVVFVFKAEVLTPVTTLAEEVLAKGKGRTCTFNKTRSG